jgi:hypothetical protein
MGATLERGPAPVQRQPEARHHRETLFCRNYLLRKIMIWIFSAAMQHAGSPM